MTAGSDKAAERGVVLAGGQVVQGLLAERRVVIARRRTSSRVLPGRRPAPPSRRDAEAAQGGAGVEVGVRVDGEGPPVAGGGGGGVAGQLGQAALLEEDLGRLLLAQGAVAQRLGPGEPAAMRPAWSAASLSSSEPAMPSRQG